MLELLVGDEFAADSYVSVIRRLRVGNILDDSSNADLGLTKASYALAASGSRDGRTCFASFRRGVNQNVDMRWKAA